MSRSALMTAPFSDTGSTFIIGPTRAWRNEGMNKLMLFCHGSGGTTVSTITDAQRQTVLDMGKDTVCICSNWAGEAWGNDAAIAAVAAAVAYARANLGCAGKIGIVGASMGNLTAMNYARANPNEVAAIASIIPAIDIQQVYTANPTPYDAYIDAAYPPSWNDAAYRSHNPIHMAQDGLLPSSIAIKIWSLSTDTLALPSTHAAFVAARPATELTSFSSAGLVHGAAAVDYVRTDFVPWLKGKL